MAAFFVAPNSGTNPPVMGNRSIIYVDGFNLYYGAVKWDAAQLALGHKAPGRYKWLNLEAYFRKLRPDDVLERIYYFTALIDGARRPNQEAYISALETLASVGIVYGKFKNRRVDCRVRRCRHKGYRKFQKREEKQTDVNIAVQMVDDAYNDRCDRFVLVTGDTDQVGAVRMVKHLRPKARVIVYAPVPTRRSNKHKARVRAATEDLRNVADTVKALPLPLLAHAQFPAQVRAQDDSIIHKPAGW